MTSHFKSTSETKGKYYEEYPGKVGGEGIFATKGIYYEEYPGKEGGDGILATNS